MNVKLQLYEARERYLMHYKSVTQFSPEDQKIGAYNNIIEAAEATTLDPSEILKCCLHKIDSIDGLVWEFDDTCFNISLLRR